MHKMWLFVAVALTGIGCSSAPSTTEASAREASTPAPAPFCTYDTEAPTATSGVLSYVDRPPHTDCVPPDGSAVFSLGFARPDWSLQFDAVRAAFKVGEPVRFEETDQAAMLALDCWSWRGAFIVTQDDVQGFSTTWSIYIDATCTDDTSKRVVGQWASR